MPSTTANDAASEELLARAENLPYPFPRDTGLVQLSHLRRAGTRSQSSSVDPGRLGGRGVNAKLGRSVLGCNDTEFRNQTVILQR